MRFLDAGESHGKGLTAIIEGVPSGLTLDVSAINAQLARRQRGYGRGGRMTIETDVVEILSGVRNHTTLGSPITLFIKNKDHESWLGIVDENDCDLTKRTVTQPRPGHADLAGCIKYGFTDARNILERASARETAIRVAVGAVARQLLEQLGVKIASHVTNIGGVTVQNKRYTLDEILSSADGEVGCTDSTVAQKMKERIDEAKAKKDTLGGKVQVIASGMPVGIGSHVHYDRKLDYALMGAVGSIQSVKAVSIGLGEDYARCLGSEVHDRMYPVANGVTRKTNNAGGIEGGISNGEDIIVNATLKPIPTVMAGLDTVDMITGKAVLSAPERSDVCAVPAGAVVVENVVAFTLAAAILETVGGDTMTQVIERIKELG